MSENWLIPELDVTSLEQSLEFYVGTLGFEIRYDRPEEKFAFLAREGAELMLEEVNPSSRRFCTAELKRPFGRGINLQIRVSDVVALFDRASAAGSEMVIPLEEKWYRKDEVELGNKQFVVADPDGYLMRFYQDLGQRPCGSSG